MLGEPVARRLCADGHRVRVFTRSLDKARARFGAEHEVVAGVGDPAEATALLGAPTTTLEQWCKQQVERR